MMRQFRYCFKYSTIIRHRHENFPRLATIALRSSVDLLTTRVSRCKHAWIKLSIGPWGISERAFEPRCCKYVTSQLTLSLLAASKVRLRSLNNFPTTNNKCHIITWLHNYIALFRKCLPLSRNIYWHALRSPMCWLAEIICWINLRVILVSITCRRWFWFVVLTFATSASLVKGFQGRDIMSTSQ